MAQAFGTAENTLDFGMTGLTDDDYLIALFIKGSSMVLNALDERTRSVNNVQTGGFGSFFYLWGNAMCSDNQGSFVDFVNGMDSTNALFLKVANNMGIVDKLAEGGD